MGTKDELMALRQRIDGIDEKLIALFAERMAVSLQVAEVKRDMPIQDAAREREVVERAMALVAGRGENGLRGETALLMRTIMALSRERQRSRVTQNDAMLLPPARQPVRGRAVCAFQGVPGAWSEQALMKFFPDAERKAAEFFQDVFLAVKEKWVDYGVVPIENSQTGAIGETYDLLRKYDCFIVGRTWLDIRHCLLAPPGMGLLDVRQVFSHPEGFRQCGRFLRGRGWDLTACRNTAVAAETAAKTNDGRTAAIGSRRAAELNGLAILVPDIMDSAGNRTSFVVIANEAEYDETCNLTSITFSTEHRAGALCETLMPFMTQGINLARIESRPASPGKYRFFAEIEVNILDPVALQTLRQAAAVCEYFQVIGCYQVRD
ncbi:MAG: chorismate mutase [Synergistaceae bacterium]|jgi:chorismate mutase/prephenate dehydratase|nr:chorismate mutase [Synergistaceae bacterium]